MSTLRYTDDNGGQINLSYSVPGGLSDAALSAMYDAYDAGRVWSLCGVEFFPPGPHMALDPLYEDGRESYRVECARAIRDHLKTYVRTVKEDRRKAAYLSAVVALADFEKIVDRMTS